MLKRLIADIEERFHPSGIRAHVLMYGDKVQVGYFDPQAKKMHSYTKEQQLPPDDIVESGKPILQLNVDDSLTSPEAALATAKEQCQTKFPWQITEQFVIVLQNPGVPQYTITGISRSLQALVVVIDATTGHVVEATSAPLAGYDRHR